MHDGHTLRLQGRLGADIKLRRSKSGKDGCRLSVGVGEGDEVTWISATVFEEKARALAGRAKGVEVYVEGKPIPECVDWQGWPATHGFVGHGVGHDAARTHRPKRPKKPRPEHSGDLPFDALEAAGAPSSGA